MKNFQKYPQLLIAIFGIIVFVPLLGDVHLFDWDEINFAEAAREMIVSKNYLTVQIDYFPFWEKPPLFIWMQVLSMKIFGINEFAARFPNAVCGVITLLVLFQIGKKIYNAEFGLWWVLAYAGSILPFVYFSSGIIDPWFNLFIFLGIWFFTLYSDEKNTINRKRNIVFSAFFIGLGVLTKGPVALLILGLTGFVFLVISKFKIRLTLIDILLYLVVASLVGGAWFILQILNGNLQLVKDFLVYQFRLFSTEDAGHGGFFGYHFVVLFLGVFPASVFALKSFGKSSTDDSSQKHFKKWMLILFWAVLILFTVVKTKIIHYSSLCYFPLTFLGAWSIQKLIEGQKKITLWQNILFVLIAIIFSALVFALPVIESNKHEIINSGFITDKFAIGNLSTTVTWGVFPYITGIFLLIGVVFSLFLKNIRMKIVTIFITTIIFSLILRHQIVTRVEAYSQRAAIEFYESKNVEDCYIWPWNFKSYAHLFYSKKRIPVNKLFRNEEWLLTGKIDKPVYFVVKNFRENAFKSMYPNIKMLYEKNGFIFFVRNPL